MSDLLFPDLADHPEVLEHHLAEVMTRVGVDPALVYTVRTTGLLVSADNEHLFEPEDLAEWYAAIEAYRTGVDDVLDDGPPA